MVGDARVDFAGPDVNGQIKAAVSSKKIEGETINVIASKDAKASKVAQVTNAIAAAKPKAIVVKTPKRDKSTGEINVALAAKREGCAAVGYIAKDSVISVWPASGAKAVTFSHGMAGPDMTRGSEGVRQAMSKCDAPYWFASADPEVKWGLVADLVFAVESPEDGGAPPKAHDVSILIKATPGRKIDDEP